MRRPAGRRGGGTVAPHGTRATRRRTLTVAPRRPGAPCLPRDRPSHTSRAESAHGVSRSTVVRGSPGSKTTKTPKLPGGARSAGRPSRSAATAGPRRWRRRSRSWSPTRRATSPARACASTAALRARCERRRRSERPGRGSFGSFGSFGSGGGVPLDSASLASRLKRRSRRRSDAGSAWEVDWANRRRNSRPSFGRDHLPSCNPTRMIT